MWIRNKKTGKVKTCDMVVITDEKIDGEIASLGRHTFIFRSIEQFNDQYEAYKPVEPLIEDERVRKAVEAWAEVNDLCGATYSERPNGCAFIFEHADGDKTVICFRSTWLGLQKGKAYGITELCEEEKE